MRSELFAHYLRLPAHYYDAASSAQMLSRLTYNIELVAEAATNSVTVLIRDTLTILALLGWLFYLNWQLTLIALTRGTSHRLAAAASQSAVPPL